METASRRSWTENENSTRTLHLREYTLRARNSSWMIGFPAANAFFGHVNVQSKAVFSNAMTTMDEIRGWEDEEKREGSKFKACMWIYTKEALTKRQIPNPAMEEYLKQRMLSMMLCAIWACGGTFFDHEWVRKHNYPECARCDGYRTGLRDWYSARGMLVHAVIFCIDNVESNIDKIRDANRKVT